MTMRAGNAGPNTVTDHVEVLSHAIAQVSGSYRKYLLIRADGAGSSHGLLDWFTAQGAKRGRTVEYSVGLTVNAKVRDECRYLSRWLRPKGVKRLVEPVAVVGLIQAESGR